MPAKLKLLACTVFEGSIEGKRCALEEIPLEKLHMGSCVDLYRLQPVMVAAEKLVSAAEVNRF